MRLSRHIAPALAVVSLLVPQSASSLQACGHPDRWQVAAAFDKAANGLLPPTYPQLADGTGIRAIPTSLLKAVGWVESGWRQFATGGTPLVSYDFGYGIMQITSGMAGAYGVPTGSLDPGVQSRIASDYIYNVAYGAVALGQKWSRVPVVGTGDPTVVEDWYYALWAYNGWGWVNNPNNPRFKREGSPALHPSSFPYQERVLYLVAHPPKDADGNFLWSPVHVSLPSRKLISPKPGPLALKKTHRQAPLLLSAIYRTGPLAPATPGGARSVALQLTNTGTQTWATSGDQAVTLSYHLMTADANPYELLSPFASGVLAFEQPAATLTEAVPPGKSIRVHAAIVAPAKVGMYQIVWDLLEGSSTLFSVAHSLPRTQHWRIEASPATSASSTPATTSPRIDDLRFVADTAVPDGTRVKPGQHFTKGWLVYNSGRHAWGTTYHLRLISGKSFGAGSIAVPSTPACGSVNILASLHAPRRAGTYKSTWRMRSPSGRLFGRVLTLAITVAKNVAGPPNATPPPIPRSTPVASPTPSG